MVWAAKPTGTRGRQPVCSDAAVQTCLTMKVLFGLALRQTTRFVESLLRLIGLNWDVPDFSTLSRRQKTLAVTIPHRGSQGQLRFLIGSTGIKVEGEGGRNARRLGGPKRRVWRKVHLGIDEETLKIRRMSHPAATWAMRPCCLSRLARSPPIRKSPASQPLLRVCGKPSPGNGRCLRHAQVPRCHCRTRGQCRDPTPQERQAAENRNGRRGRARRCAAGVKTPWTRALATMERMSPPKGGRDNNALRQTAGPAPHGARLRPPVRGVPGPCCRAGWRHRARHPCHGSRGASLSRDSGNPTVSGLRNRAD